ncbi:hypothetical protein N0V84_007187 [Fusarium piperis]|uniref:Uncharacterized protein n=1 Tax=Fusarium piperis TaxID=1435070 RepID=A0A9W8WAG1_9HYPO|nr:hypothetical protein N0V84_007187 [Fusarium piperis]
MSCNWKWLGLILACMVGVAHADPWDDFANNLFTDLAPLLALFGERATMQFMSQALGWEDCIILAMAPLGIITVLVSAIRVGGPAWLKAVIGRARENMSAAEMELMSSTSKEVCELYNGQTIVRCQGSTPVWEFIYLIPIGPLKKDPNKKFDIKVFTLKEACQNKLLHQLDGDPPQSEALKRSEAGLVANIKYAAFASSQSTSTRDASIESGDLREPVSEHPPNEAIYVIRNMGTDAPSIILNLQNHNGNRKELRAYAMIGVILQLCVLVFFGIITYHPTIKNSFRKDDQRVDDYAFPLAISGTLVLALGVFICGTVVESSTKETHYKKNDNYEMRIAWIQQKQTVGDQVFEPFATFPDTSREIVTVSRRCNTSQAQALEPLTIIGIFTGLAGFIIQFIGLRGMNSAATLAQLGVVGIMTAIRAWVRRGLAKPPKQEKLTSGFELDILAWALALSNGSQNGSQNEKPGPNAPLISSVNNATHGDTPQRAEQSLRDLAQLESIVQGASATEAINLATAMEKTMSVLFPLRSEDPEQAWAWPLAVVSESYVNISLTGKDGAWKILADQLESVLSLCLFTAQKEEESRSKDGQTQFNLNDENDDWLRPKTINSGLGIRLVGSKDAEKSDQLIQDLCWWAPETFDALAEIAEIQEFKGDNSKERPGRCHEHQPESPLERETRGELDRIIESDPKLDSICIDDNRVVGYGPTRPQSRTRQRHFRNFSTLTEEERKQRRRGTLVAVSNDSLEKLYAKDLLFSFLIAAAKTGPTGLQTAVTTRETTTRTSLNSTSKVLVTSEMTSLATEFVRLGYGAEQEAWLSIIAPLSITEELPFPPPLVDLAREGAEKMRVKRDWAGATEIYLELWSQTQHLSSSAEKIRGWGTAILMEYLHDVEDEDKRKRTEDKNRILYTGPDENMCRIRSRLKASKHQPGFFAHLLRLYETQGRPVKLQFLQDLAGGTSTSQNSQNSQNGFPDYFGVTELHSKAVDASKDAIRACDEEVWKAINDKDISGWTPLHYAASRGNKGAIEALKEMGADPNLQSLNGSTPAHYLCQAGDQQDLQWMDTWKLEARDLGGATPMHAAAGSGNLELIKLWTRREEESLPWTVTQEAPLTSKLRDHNGRLPIHWAVIHGHEKVVEALKSTVDEADIYESVTTIGQRREKGSG